MHIALGFGLVALSAMAIAQGSGNIRISTWIIA